MKGIKLISIIFLVIVIANIILFAMSVTSTFVFWFVIALCALVAYVFLPKLRKQQ